MPRSTTLNLPDMKITLFAMNGSYAHSSLAIRALRDALQTAGFADVTLLEATLRDRRSEVLAKLVAERCEIYGFSCYIWNIREMLSLAEDLRAVHPHCRIVLGGPDVSFAPERFTVLPFVDTVITGEGEEAIVSVARAARAGEPLPRLVVCTPDPHFPEACIHLCLLPFLRHGRCAGEKRGADHGGAAAI